MCKRESKGKFYNNKNGSIVSWTSTAITVKVPTGATTGPLKVKKGTQFSNEIPFVVGDEGEEYVHADAIGSIRMVTGHQGYVLARYDYLPFGEPWPPGGEVAPEGFAGAPRDGETATSGWMALNYLGARHLHAASGRFTTVDPGHVGGHLGDPQTWNGYAYAGNNPLRFVDPDGRCAGDAQSAARNAEATGTYYAVGCPDDQLRKWAAALARALDFEEWVRAADDEMALWRQSLWAQQLPTFDEALKQASDFSAGVGDALTGRMIPGVDTSLPEYIRGGMGTDSVVSKDGLTYKAGEVTGSTVGWTLAGSASATAAAVANGKHGALFGRGKNTVFNSGRVRFGWNWHGPWDTGRDVIRLGIGPKGGTKWWSHIDFWYP